ALRARIASAVDALRARFPDPAALRARDELKAFRDIYQASGVNPNKIRPGCERLVQHVWKQGDLPHVNNVVDAYNLVSLTHLLSLGAHDLDAIARPVRLT